jgi:hypothetical protein
VGLEVDEGPPVQGEGGVSHGGRSPNNGRSGLVEEGGEGKNGNQTKNAEGYINVFMCCNGTQYV